jgi:hypothetical protein
VVEHLPSKYEALSSDPCTDKKENFVEPSVVVYSYSLSTWEAEAEDQEFEVSLGSLVRSRPAWVA